MNNAGIANFAPIEDYTLEQWNLIIAINLTGTFNGIKAAIPALKKSGHGSIINISSTAGIKGVAALPGYTAAKFAVRGLTKEIAIDLGRYNMRANSIHPGNIRTPMTDGLDVDQSLVPLGRMGDASELSAMVLYLASDESSFSTGAEFIADGGETAGVVPPAVQSGHTRGVRRSRRVTTLVHMISIRSASDVPWADVERVFATPGDPRTCWCRYFKLTGAQWTATDVAARVAALREDARRADPTPGLVAFVDDEPAGWVAVEPRVNLPRLFRSRVVAAGMSDQFDDASVWSVVCFVVRREFRGQGVAGELVRGAVDHARSSGATTIEAYPIEPALVKGSPAGSMYHGTVSMFRAAGFDEIRVGAPARRIMTLAV